MKINQHGGVCMFCNTSGAHDYSIHSRGKNAKINYFHPECYRKAVKERNEKLHIKSDPE